MGTAVMGARLVRDHIGNVRWKVEEAKTLLRPVAHYQEHLSLLRSKLLEEVGEFLAAGTQGARINEAADVLQVLIDFIRMNEPDPDDMSTSGEIRLVIIHAQSVKGEELGGFTHGVVWET
jgi:predicted house-cleaning noncanonical NTP pyrophosphatase (MazG superfamily)